MESKESIHIQIFEAAKQGNFELVKDLYNQGGDVNMIIMGASEGERTEENKKILYWSIEHGACFLFSFKQPERNYTLDKSGNSFFSRVSMIKGPGDIAKGSFKFSTETKSD